MSVHRLPRTSVPAPRLVEVARAPEAANDPHCCSRECATDEACPHRPADPVLLSVLVALLCAICLVAILLGGPQ